MLWARLAGCLGSIMLTAAAYSPTAKSLDDALSHLTLDGEQTYRVRDLHLTRGDVKIYLNEGVLSFASSVNGRVVAAVFSTEAVEAGDAEILALPPTRSERTSLAAYTKSPNLNEHFGSAVFFFSDATLRECLQQIGDLPSHRAPQLAAQLRPKLEPVLGNIYTGLDLRLVQALLDAHQDRDGFFFATIAGRDLGVFNLLHDPRANEPVTLGRNAPEPEPQIFQLWTSYRPKRASALKLAASTFSEYRIHASIAQDLAFSARAEFTVDCDESSGRVLRFDLSDQLGVTAAAIDGESVEVLERKKLPQAGESQAAGAFLLIAGHALYPGAHTIQVSYKGHVIDEVAPRVYFVGERNTWYPQAGTLLTHFDLTFECPENLQLVSTGELISDTVTSGLRTVHRRTMAPAGLAGFNLGDYSLRGQRLGDYQVDVFANRQYSKPTEDLGTQTASILQDFTSRWLPLRFHTLAISPISGYFGQGFPGLIYLSDIAYVRQKNRPAPLRTPLMDSFFSGMLLPHEVAHQWWGNLVVPADYRSAWLMEAMASYSALQYLLSHRDPSAMDSVLEQYRRDLLSPRNGNTVEAAGPVDFGVRLWDTAGKPAWQTITYEKGAWLLHMLQARLGEERWRQAQLKLLTEYQAHPLSNEAFQKTVAALLPPGQPDPQLQLFFDTWVYGTGIPRLTLSRKNEGWELEMSQVDEDFTVDVPVECRSKTGHSHETRWIRATTGTTLLPSRESAKICSLPPPNQFLYQ